MSRRISSDLLRRLRDAKGWSQEELAIAASLSTRTIQRMESEGGGSINSIKSVASALEVEMHNLEEVPRTQLIGVKWGYAGVIAGSSLAVVAVLYDWLYGGGTSFSAGVSLGVIGCLAGASAAYIGWASGKTKKG